MSNDALTQAETPSAWVWCPHCGMEIPRPYFEEFCQGKD